MNRILVSPTSKIGTAAPAVWERISSFEGINTELMPWMRMRPPHRYAGRTLADITPGEPLGRVWIFYLGFLPLDWDSLTVEELEVGHRFAERSTMASMAVWEHERIVTALGSDHCEVTDRVAFVPRLPFRPARRALRRTVTALFAHRHRRLVDHFNPR